MSLETIAVAIGAALIVMVLPRLLGPKKAGREEILAAVQAGARVIDVRTSGEFSSGAYPKARNIPLDRLQDRLGELGAKDGAVVVYCASGSRSAQAVAFLKKNGFTRVLNGGGLGEMPRA